LISTADLSGTTSYLLSLSFLIIKKILIIWTYNEHQGIGRGKKLNLKHYIYLITSSYNFNEIPWTGPIFFKKIIYVKICIIYNLIRFFILKSKKIPF
jgi:hypothetical protein